LSLKYEPASQSLHIYVKQLTRVVPNAPEWQGKIIHVTGGRQHGNSLDEGISFEKFFFPVAF
jgi:hypothetical protein